MAKSNTNLASIPPVPATLPFIGKSRWAQIKPISHVSREKFRQLYIEGKAPPPIRLGVRCTVFDNAELHKWLNDPVGYRAPGFNNA